MFSIWHLKAHNFSTPKHWSHLKIIKWCIKYMCKEIYKYIYIVSETRKSSPQYTNKISNFYILWATMIYANLKEKTVKLQKYYLIIIKRVSIRESCQLIPFYWFKIKGFFLSMDSNLNREESYSKVYIFHHFITVDFFSWQKFLFEYWIWPLES